MKHVQSVSVLHQPHARVMPHIRMSHITKSNASYLKCERYFICHMNESCRTHEWVMSHVWMSHVECDSSEIASCHSWHSQLSRVSFFSCERIFRVENIFYFSAPFFFVELVSSAIASCQALVTFESSFRWEDWFCRGDFLFGAHFCCNNELSCYCVTFQAYARAHRYIYVYIYVYIYIYMYIYK